jgi:DNA-binding winged helix-turn-helix (wHTH) protein
MVHRFGTFEIDEATRELRAGGRVLPLQPRVFDLLVYLAKHAARVVPKDELLEAVWPGVLVTDGSLQRAVSLARSALAEAGAADAIRTHARQGYRLCAGAAVPASAVDAPPRPADALTAAHAAYARGDWDAAIAALRRVDDLEGLTAADLQLWAHAAQCAGRPQEAAEPLERAVAAYSARGDRRRAAWVAILLAQLRVEWREPVVARGWIQRAARLLENEPPCRERGYLDLLGARMALLQSEIETCLHLAENARATGAQFGDADLESLGLVHVGEARLYLGHIRDGMAALDEAAVSVIASGLSPWAGGLVYCGVIYGCMTQADWQRAGQWTEQYTRWSSDKGTAAYPGLCRLHRAEVLAVRGDLRQAEEEIRGTIETLARQAPWAEGDAWVALGDILLARGALDTARQAYTRAIELGWDAQFGLAMVRHASGDAAGAAAQLGRILTENAWSARSRRGQALAQFAIVAAAANRLDEARTALAELDRHPDLVATPALQALAARARGEVAAAAGDTNGALTHLRAALRLWLAAEAPLSAAQARCRIADLLQNLGDAESARLELDAAVTTFEQAGADGLLRQCARLKAAFAARAPAR